MKREARAIGQLGKWAIGQRGKGRQLGQRGKWKNGQLQKVKHMCNARVKGIK